MDTFKKHPASIGATFLVITLILSFAFLLANEQIQRPFPVNGIHDSIRLKIDKNNTGLEDERKTDKYQTGRLKAEEYFYIVKTL